MHHYFMATGVHAKSVADEFKEHADDEREHADSLAERIQQLGGKPNFDPKGLLERSVSQYVEGETLAEMIREDLIAERMVIEVYQDMVRYFGTTIPLPAFWWKSFCAKKKNMPAIFPTCFTLRTLKPASLKARIRAPIP